MPSGVNVSALSEVPVPDLSRSALLVSHIEVDHRFLEELFFQKQWTLARSATVQDAVWLLQRNEIPVVISERDVPGGGWKEILSALQCLRCPPLLVVTSRLADDHLWAEVLNLGGHDVLATPFNTKELVWVLENAWRHSGATSAPKALTASAASF